MARDGGLRREGEAARVAVGVKVPAAAQPTRHRDQAPRPRGPWQAARGRPPPPPPPGRLRRAGLRGLAAPAAPAQLAASAAARAAAGLRRRRRAARRQGSSGAACTARGQRSSWSAAHAAPPPPALSVFFRKNGITRNALPFACGRPPLGPSNLWDSAGHHPCARKARRLHDEWP